MTKRPGNLVDKFRDRSKSGVIRKSIDFVTKSSKLLGSVNHSPLGKIVLNYFCDVERHHGTRSALNQTKALYNESIRFSCGLKVEPSTPIWVKRDRDNFPIVLRPLRSPLRGGVIERRIVLSYLRTFESIQLRPVPNLETVTSPSEGRKGFESIRDSFNNFLERSAYAKRLRESFREEVDHQTKIGGIPFHFSSKKGVRGPTIATAGLQSLAIDQDMKGILKEFNSIFRKGDWVGILEENQSYFEENRKDLYNDDKTYLNTQHLGRITFVPDKGGKTRLVAIGNYWIQDCLLQLHKVIYRVLRHLQTDGTYAQTSQFERCREASSKGPVWSYDLTAATDRFPVEPQIAVLKSLHKEAGSLWERILEKLDFYYEGQVLKYSVGQPMGLYSSWAVFALTHHFVIQYCAWLERKKFPFNEYAVLGDDVAIWSSSVARRYREILTLLDVKISEGKSFTPENLSGPCVAEFAKRISDKGVEITPLSPNQNNEAWSSYWNWPSYASWLTQHGFDLRAIPASRIRELSNLSKGQFRNLCCSLYIWEVLRAPSFEGVTLALPENFVQVATPSGIVKLRIEVLVEQASSLWSDLWSLGDDNRAALEDRLEGPVPDNLYFIRVLDTRIQSVIDLENRLVKFIPDEFDVYFDEDLDRPEGDEDLPELSEIEYLPRVTLEELLKGLTRSDSKRVMRNRYIQTLVKKAKSLTEPLG